MPNIYVAILGFTGGFCAALVLVMIISMPGYGQKNRYNKKDN
jgi:hypothetical protein